MKSDREFLDGVYAKAEKIKSYSALDGNLISKEISDKLTNKHANSYKYVKYAATAASVILLISSALFINAYSERNKQIPDKPVPRNIKIPDYTDQLMNQATDIVAVKSIQENNMIVLNIIKSYKSSANDLHNYFDNDLIKLDADQTAILFINADSIDTPLIDIFIWEPADNYFVNPDGVTITEETLNKFN